MQLTLSFPTSDTGLLQWSQTVVNLITPTPATWGLVVGDVTTYTALHTSYSTSLAACSPTLRSKTTTAAKNTARTALKNGATLLGNKIYASPAVTDAMKIEIGMPPRATPQPRPAPTSFPVIEIVSVSAWTAMVRLRVSAGARRGLPAGCIGASIFSHVGETAPSDLSQWKFEGSTGRVVKLSVDFPSTLAAGTKAWLTAFYFNARKQSGPMCAPISLNLPGGSVAMAA